MLQKDRMYVCSEVMPYVLFLQEVVIQQDDEIRVKIVGTRVDATDIVSPSWFTLFTRLL